MSSRPLARLCAASIAMRLWLHRFWWPRCQGTAYANNGHTDFRFAIGKKVSNPPRCVDLPINERCMAGYIIPVKPECRPCQRDHPSCDRLFAHNKPSTQRATSSRTEKTTPLLSPIFRARGSGELMRFRCRTRWCGQRMRFPADGVKSGRAFVCKFVAPKGRNKRDRCD